jgi:hypothetical protein
MLPALSCYADESYPGLFASVKALLVHMNGDAAKPIGSPLVRFARWLVSVSGPLNEVQSPVP